MPRTELDPWRRENEILDTEYGWYSQRNPGLWIRARSPRARGRTEATPLEFALWMGSNASYLHSSEEASLPRINRRFLLKETRTLAAKPGTRYSNAYFCASQVPTNGLMQGNSRQASTDKLRSDRTMKAAVICCDATTEAHN